MTGRRWLGTFAGIALAGALAIGGTGAYFTDLGEISRAFHAVFEEDPDAAPECSGMVFKKIIAGTPGDDTIDAGNGGVLVLGLGGDDTIRGGNGKDCLIGGTGDDHIFGDNGRDVVV
ncbi:MAG TPA: hypothetical protein VF253_14500, partial [Candidatus Limnocylindrales bacterium]